MKNMIILDGVLVSDAVLVNNHYEFSLVTDDVGMVHIRTKPACTPPKLVEGSSVDIVGRLQSKTCPMLSESNQCLYILAEKVRIQADNY